MHTHAHAHTHTRTRAHAHTRAQSINYAQSQAHNYTVAQKKKEKEKRKTKERKMKKKTHYYLDRWKKKISKGKDKEWNTLEVNENRLKWDKVYKQKIIDRFQSMYDKCSEVKKIKVQLGRKTITHYKEKRGVYREYVPRALVGIQKRNEQMLRDIEYFNTELKGKQNDNKETII